MSKDSTCYSPRQSQPNPGRLIKLDLVAINTMKGIKDQTKPDKLCNLYVNHIIEMETSSSKDQTVSEATEQKEENSVAQKPETIEGKVQTSTPQFKNPASPYTALKDSMKEGVGPGVNRMRFFGPRFMTVWVMPIAITGIVMEFLFVAPLRSANPFS